MKNFLDLACQDKRTETFAQYFKSYYSDRSECWASCFRKHAFVNTNMFLEAMHKTLKYCVYEKKVIRRLDHSIHLVTVLFNDIHSEYMQKIRKPCANRKTSAIFKNHKLCLKESANLLVNKEPDSEKFIVEDTKNSRKYEITLSDSKSHNCNLACVHCGFCVHTFICSCSENSIKGAFCIHLHRLSLISESLPKFERPINKLFDKYYNVSRE